MNEHALFYARYNRGGSAPAIAEAPILYYDLTVVLEGELCYRIDGAELLLKAGDVIFIKKGMLRERKASAERADYISFNFHTENPPTLPLVMRGVARHEMQLIATACDEIIRRTPLGHEPIVSHLLSAMLALLQSHESRTKVSPLTGKIMRHIARHFSERITLADIGRLTFFSPVYCDTVFKKDMGVSIIDYLLTQRIEAAKRLLLEGSYSLSDVAHMTGFEDSNYFSRVFKKRTGYTPTQYKKGLRA